MVYASQFTEGVRKRDKKEILDKIMNATIETTLDAIMYLSGSNFKHIGATAFSILSLLSKFSSNCESVMSQIKRDIELPADITSKGH